MRECISQSYTFLFSDQFVSTVFWKSAIRNFIAQWTFGDKGNIHRWNPERSFLGNFLVMCEIISQSYTYVSWSSPLTLSLRNLRRASLDHIEAYADKGNFTRSKRERSFLRNFFLICEFISRTYNLDIRKQFANTLFVESAKWYLGAHRGTWWKSKYPHIITMEKLSERLLSDVLPHHTEFHLYLLGTVC